MAALAEEIARRKAAAALTDLGEEDTSEGAELDPNSEPDPDDSADTETPADKEVPSVQTTTVTRAPARFNPNAQTLADYFGPPSGPAAPPRSAKDQSGEIPGESLTDDSGKLAGPLTLSAEAAIREGRPTPTPVKLNPEQRQRLAGEGNVPLTESGDLDFPAEAKAAMVGGQPQQAPVAAQDIELPGVTIEGKGTPLTSQRAIPARMNAHGIYDDEKPEDFVNGKATRFADQADIDAYNAAKAKGASDNEAFQVGDNGIGSKYLGGLPTTDLYGVAIPENVLRYHFGNNYADWRKARVDVVDPSSGKRLRVPVVDVGPGEGPQAKGVVADLTPGMDSYFDNQGGGKNLLFKLVPNGGPDVTKHPDVFANEQAAIRAGYDSSTIQPGRQKIGPRPYNYTLTPEDPSQSVALDQADTFNKQSQLDTLTQLSDQNPNIVGLYKQLGTDVSGVSPAMRQQFRDNLKPQIIGLMQQKFPGLSDDEAWNKAQSDVNALDVGRDFWSKLVGNFQSVGATLQKATSPSAEQLHLTEFLNQALPKASDAEKHAFLTQLYATPPEARGEIVSAYIANPQAGVPGQDPTQVVSALDRLSDPNWIRQENARQELAQKAAQQSLSSDPRLTATMAEGIINPLAQIPEMVAAAGIPPLMAAQVSDQVREQLKTAHPEWGEEELDQKAAYSTLVQFVGQEAAGRLLGAGIGPAIGVIKAPVKRAIAQALGSTAAAATVSGAAQVGSNIVTGEPLGAGVGQAALAGAIQGGAGGLVHGGAELLRPRPEARPIIGQPEPEAAPTTGPAGGALRGARPETMAPPEPEAPTPTEPEPAPPQADVEAALNKQTADLFSQHQAAIEPEAAPSVEQNVPQRTIPAGPTPADELATRAAQTRADIEAEFAKGFPPEPEHPRVAPIEFPQGAQPEAPLPKDPAQAKLESYRQESDEDLAYAWADNKDQTAKQVLAERYPKGFPDHVKNITVKARREARAAMTPQQLEDEARQQHQDEMAQAAAAPEGQDHLLQAIAKSGGLPSPARMKQLASRGETMTGEFERVIDAWKALPLAAKKELGAEGVTYNKLFTKDAQPLDVFRGDLAQHPDGYNYGHVGDLLADVETALQAAAQGKRIYGSGAPPDYTGETPPPPKVGSDVLREPVRYTADVARRRAAAQSIQWDDPKNQALLADSRQVINETMPSIHALGAEYTNDRGENYAQMKNGKVSVNLDPFRMVERHYEVGVDHDRASAMERARTVAREELIHAADIKGIIDEYRASPEPDPGSLNGFYWKHILNSNEQIFSMYREAKMRGDTKTAKLIGDVIEHSMAMYLHPEAENPRMTVAQVQEALRGGTSKDSRKMAMEAHSIMRMELARQLIQANDRGITTETVGRKLIGTLTEYFQRILNTLKTAYQKVRGGEFGPQMAKAIDRVEKTLAGLNNLKAGKDPLPEHVEAANTTRPQQLDLFHPPERRRQVDLPLENEPFRLVESGAKREPTDFQLEIQKAKAARKLKPAVERGKPTEFKWDQPEAFRLEREITGAKGFEPPKPPPEEGTGSLFRIGERRPEEEGGGGRAPMPGGGAGPGAPARPTTGLGGAGRGPISGLSQRARRAATWYGAVFKGGESFLLDHRETRPLARAERLRPSLAQKFGARARVNDLADAFNQIPGRDRARVVKEFSDYVRAEQTKAPLPAVGADTRRVLDAGKYTMEQLGAIARELNVHVKTSDGQIRPMKLIGRDYYPRMISNDAHDIINNRDTSRAADFNRMVNDSIARGTVKTRDEFIDKFAQATAPDTTTNGHFNNVEKAREAQLPLDFYDFSPAALLKYANRATDRLSQIGAFGQKLSNKGKDLFDHTIEELEKSRMPFKDKQTVITRVRQEARAHYAETQPSNLDKASNLARSAASGLFLGNPVTSMYNLISGAAQNLTFGGPGAFLKTATQFATGKKMLDAMKEARERNILKSNLSEILHDYDLVTDQGWATKGVQGFTRQMLHWGGQNITEGVNRAFAMQQGKYILNQFARLYGQNNARARSLYAMIERRGIGHGQLNDLAREKGNGPLTDEFLRQFVMDVHGNYGPSQSAAHLFDSPAGKVLTQFQKWGANTQRIATREFLMPMVKAARDRQPADFAYHLMRNVGYLAAAVGAGGVAQWARNFITGKQPNDPTIQEIWKRFGQGEGLQALQMGLQRAWGATILSGFTGTLGNYADLAGQLAGATPGTRVHDPLHPPAWGAVQPLIEFIQGWHGESNFGAAPSRQVLDTLGGNLLSAYRTGKQISLNAANAAGLKMPLGQEYAAKNDLSFLRQRVKQFENDNPVFRAKREQQGNRQVTLAGRGEFDPIRDDVQAALLTGHPEEAQRRFADWLDRFPPADQKKQLQAIKQSIQASSPIKPGGSYSLDSELQFLTWAKQNLPEAEARKIFATAATYAKTAVQTGIFPSSKTMQQIARIDFDKYTIPKKNATVNVTIAHPANQPSLADALRRQAAARALMAH